MVQAEFHVRVQVTYDDLRNWCHDIMPGGLGGCTGCPPPGISGGCVFGRPYRKIKSLHFPVDILAAIDIWAVASGCEVKAIQGAVQGICWLVLKHRFPQQRAALGMLPRGGCPQPAPCDPEGGSLLRNPVQTLTQRQPPRLWTGHSL